MRPTPLLPSRRTRTPGGGGRADDDALLENVPRLPTAGPKGAPGTVQGQRAARLARSAAVSLRT